MPKWRSATRASCALFRSNGSCRASKMTKSLPRPCILRKGIPTVMSTTVRPGPVEFTRARVKWSWLQIPILYTGERQHLAVITGLEDFVRVEEILPCQAALIDVDASIAQQPDHPLPGDAVQKGAVGNRGVKRTFLGEPDIGRGQLSHVAQRIQHGRIVEAAAARLAQGPPAVGIEAGGLGIGGRRLDRRSPEGREGDGGATGLRQRRIIDAEAKAGGFRIIVHEAALGPIHQTDVEGGAPGKLRDSLLAELEDLPGFVQGLQAHRPGRVVDPPAVQVQVRCNPFKCPGSIEYTGSQPERMAHRPHQPRVPFQPFSLNETPGCHRSPLAALSQKDRANSRLSSAA